MSIGRFIGVFCAPLLLYGCATLPDYLDSEITTADVVKNIKCELRDAAWQQNPKNEFFSGWKAALIVTLEVFHKGGQESDASLIVPLNPGTLTVALTTGLTGEATRTERIYFKEKLDDLNSDLELMCPSNAEKQDRHALLGGQLGIVDVFNRARESMHEARISPTQMDYNLDFVIKSSGSASAKFAMIPVGVDRIFGGSVKVLGSRNDTHTLKITLTPIKSTCMLKLVDGKCPTPIYTAFPNRNLSGKELQGIAPSRRGIVEGRPIRVRRTTPGGLSPAEADDLDRASTRNILQGIDDQLRREGLGN